MSRPQSGPARTDVPALSWLLSRWVWAATLGLAAWLVVLVAVVGAVWHGSGLLATAGTLLADPWGVLAVVLAARALAMYLAQRRRDYDVAAGELGVTDDTSVGAMVSVASFGTIGLLAAAVPLPLLYSTSGNYRLLAVGVAVVAVPTSYALLVYQLGEQVAADRYRRGYRASPAVYHYLWTLPVVVLAWLVVGGVGAVEVPTGAVGGYYGGSVHVGAADLLYVVLWTPTALAFGYPLRRVAERLVRGLVPGR